MKRTFHHPLPFGAETQPDGHTLFRLWAPSAAAILLRLPEGDAPMHTEPGGWHRLAASAPAGTPYSFVLPDGLAVPDPAARQQAGGVHGPSLVGDPAGFAWQHPDWLGRPWHEAVLYECHAGLMGGFKGVQARLPGLARMGITAVELMPIAGVPGSRNWGYDGVLPYAPDGALGSPDELKALIDAAHGMGLMMLLDVVYNHFGPDGAYIHAYAKPFFRDDAHTPWGAAIDFRRPEVRDYFTQNALFWLDEYRFDGLRFDAVHAISEESFLIDMAGAIRDRTEGRQIHLVLEHEGNRAALLCIDGTERLYDAQWADDLHHCLHVLLTHDTEGYYKDFREATPLLARCLAEGFAYQGDPTPRTGLGRGEPSAHLPPTAFVICLQNHDQIGNRAMGERLTVLARPQALRAATALLLLSPFIPMLFMGEEWASTTPFLFFTDHTEDLAELVRTGRRAEFKSFAAFQDKSSRNQIPDPNAPATFERSRPEATDPGHADWLAALLAVRRTHIMPGIPGCRSDGAEVLRPGAVRAAWTLGGGKTLTIALNLGDATIETTPADRTMLFASAGATPAVLPPDSITVTLG